MTSSNSDERGAAMHDSDDRDPVEVLAAEFLDRRRDGEFPSIEEYAGRFPDLAEEIRDLFPMIAQMEQLKSCRGSDGRASMAGTQLTELGDFRIIGEVGRGGMGIVYEAEQKSLGRHVAVKVLPKQSLLNPRQLQRFQREAQAAARLHHTNIVPVFGVGEHDGFHYIVMQFITGVGLDEVIGELRRIVLGKEPTESHHSSSGRASHVLRNANSLLNGDFQSTKNADVETAHSLSLSVKPRHWDVDGMADTQELPQATTTVSEDAGARSADPLDYKGLAKEYWQSVAKISVQAARALEYAHRQGTLHRDIKPGNLLLDSDGTVWVADFGLAKLDEHDEVSRTGDIVGTLGYMPPERLQGEADARSDIYSLGLTIYEMLTLEPAFRASDRAQLINKIVNERPTSPSRRNPNVPRDLETIALKAIAADPKDRYQTAWQLADDLDRYLKDMPIQARRTSLIEHLTRWCRRNKQVAALAATALSLLVLSAILSFAFAVTTKHAYTQVEDANDKLTAALVGQKESTLQAEAALKRTEQIAELAIQAMQTTADKLAPSTSSFVQSGLYGDSELDDVLDTETPDFALSRRDAEILQAQLDFFDKVAKLSGDEPNMVEKSANAYRNVADKRRRLGQFDEAIAALDNAIEKYEELSKTDGTKERTLQLVRALNELGDVYSAKPSPDDQYHEALRTKSKESHQRARVILDKELAKDNEAPQVRFERAYTLFMLGTVDRRMRFSSLNIIFQGGGPGGRAGPPRGDGDGRRRSPNGGGLPGGRRDGGRPPGPPSGPHPEDHGPGRRGDGPRGTDADGELIEEATATLEDLRKESPHDANYRYLLARCYAEYRPRRVENVAGNRDELHAHFTQLRQEFARRFGEAKSLLDDLVAEYPNEPDYRFELARVHVRHAFMITFMWRDFEDGNAESEDVGYVDRFADAINLLQSLVDQNPNIPSYLQELIGVLRLSAKAASNPSGDQAIAAQRYDQAIALVDQFMLAAPEQTAQAMITRADLLLRKTGLLRDAGNLVGAENTLRKVIDELSPYVARRAPIPAHPPLLSRSEQAFDTRSQRDERHQQFAARLVERAYEDLVGTLIRQGDESAALEAVSEAEKYEFPRGRRSSGRPGWRSSAGDGE